MQGWAMVAQRLVAAVAVVWIPTQAGTIRHLDPLEIVGVGVGVVVAAAAVVVLAQTVVTIHPHR